MQNPPMAKKNDRITLPSLGEEYEDLLRVDAILAGRTPGQQAHSLLQARLQGRREDIKARVAYLAGKRGIPDAEMWAQMVTGQYEKITPEEWATMPSDGGQ
jgi:hypothetical protein